MDYLAAKPTSSKPNYPIYDHQRGRNQQHRDWQRNACPGQIYPVDRFKWDWRGYFLMDLDLIQVPTRQQIDRLQSEMVKLPQAELQTEHFFSPGMYCRRVFRPAGTLIVGKVHKEPHFFLCAMGEIIAWTETGMKKLRAGDVVECQPGTKRVTLAVTDAIGITIHKTDKTDLDEIETELVEPDDLALFDSSNKLKQIVSKMKALEGETL